MNINSLAPCLRRGDGVWVLCNSRAQSACKFFWRVKWHVSILPIAQNEIVQQNFRGLQMIPLSPIKTCNRPASVNKQFDSFAGFDYNPHYDVV